MFNILYILLDNSFKKVTESKKIDFLVTSLFNSLDRNQNSLMQVCI